MDPTRTVVGATERTQDAGRTEGQTDRVKPIYPPRQLCCAEGITILTHGTSAVVR